MLIRWKEVVVLRSSAVNQCITVLVPRSRTSALQLCLPLHEQLNLVLQVDILYCVGLRTCDSPTSETKKIY